MSRQQRRGGDSTHRGGRRRGGYCEFGVPKADSPFGHVLPRAWLPLQAVATAVQQVQHKVGSGVTNNEARTALQHTEGDISEAVRLLRSERAIPEVPVGVRDTGGGPTPDVAELCSMFPGATVSEVEAALRNTDGAPLLAAALLLNTERPSSPRKPGSPHPDLLGMSDPLDQLRAIFPDVDPSTFSNVVAVSSAHPLLAFTCLLLQERRRRDVLHCLAVLRVVPGVDPDRVFRAVVSAKGDVAHAAGVLLSEGCSPDPVGVYLDETIDTTLQGRVDEELERCGGDVVKAVRVLTGSLSPPCTDRAHSAWDSPEREDLQPKGPVWPIHLNRLDTVPEVSCEGVLRCMASTPTVLARVPEMPRLVTECVSLLAQKAPLPDERLTDDQRLAVLVFTYDLGTAVPVEQQFYYTLNAVLRDRDAATLPDWRDYLHYLFGALDALPNEVGPAARGLPHSAIAVFEQDYGVGRKVHWSGFTSVSKEEAPAEGFARLGGVILHIQVVSGKCIAPYSSEPSENEILLLPNTELVVASPLKEEGGYRRIHLVQIASSGTLVF